jgi:hypothetical protein
VHLEAELCLVNEKNSESSYSAHFNGTHIYYTNKRNERSLSFTVLVEKGTGIMTLSEGD